MSYDLLAPGVQRWIDSHSWTEWTPIQSQAIPQILDGKGALLVAPTASGKTEAAVLPIISEIVRERLAPIALLYVSPLRALINDQTRRAQNLLEENGLNVGWWHGDLSASQRKKLLAEPPHALFTTPESVEVIMSSDGYGHGAMLGNVRFVLIDEIHAFAVDDRGAQLMSLLARLETEKQSAPTRIALSATVTNAEGIVDWMRSSRPEAAPIVILEDTSAKVRRVGVGLLEQHTDANGDVSPADQRRLSVVLRKHVEGKRAIIFVNARADAESLGFQLREMGLEAMVHHGSIHKEERERVEASFRLDGPKLIVATGTLELGIDIGDLELIVQVGPPHTASSLLQRIGRSGRRGDAQSTCIMYARSLEELPVALAVGELALEGNVEHLYPNTAALHVLFQQVLQLLRERTRVGRSEIAGVLLRAGSFRDISSKEYEDLISEMIEMKYLEEHRDWLVLGPMTEERFGRMNYRDFYAVFETQTEWTVRTDGDVIGTIDRKYPVSRNGDTYLILGGRSWRVKNVDETRLILLVEPAKRVSVPKWHSLGPGPSFEVMQRTFSIICGQAGKLETPPLSEKLAAERADAASKGYQAGHVFVEGQEGDAAIVTYFGSTLNQYVAMLLQGALEVEQVRATPSQISFRASSSDEVPKVLGNLLRNAGARSAALEVALPRISQVHVGRFWPMFGTKTREHVLRRFYLAAEPLIGRVAGMEIRHRDTPSP